MGKASGGDRQNLGDVVGRFHVTAAKHGGRAPITVPKGTRPPRTGRGTQRLLGDGNRGKDEGGDEPQGCASRRAPGAGESRSYEGSRPLCRLGNFCGNLLAGFAFRRSEEHTSELQSHFNLVCRLLLEKKKHPRPNRTSPPRRTDT